MTMLLPIFFVSLTLVIHCGGTEKDAKKVDKLMGVDTIHVDKMKPRESVTINKDTIITRNLKLENKGKSKNVPATTERDPDWSYSAIPQEVSIHVAQFKRNMTECLKEVQAADTRPVKRLSPKPESPVHGECLIACVLKRNHVIVNGKANKENLLNLVSKFFAKETKLMKKLEKNVDQCIAMSARHTSECDLAARLNECTNDLMNNNKRKVVVNY